MHMFRRRFFIPPSHLFLYCPCHPTLSRSNPDAQRKFNFALTLSSLGVALIDRSFSPFIFLKYSVSLEELFFFSHYFYSMS